MLKRFAFFFIAFIALLNYNTIINADSTRYLLSDSEKPKLVAAEEGRVIMVFGLLSDIDIASSDEDMWNGVSSGEYTFSTTANINTISSSDNADTHELTIYGLDEDWGEEVITCELTGTAAATFEPSLIRINKVVVTTVGTAPAGDVYVSISGATITAGVPVATQRRGFIASGDYVSKQAIYTIPSGYNGFIVSRGVALAKTQNNKLAEVSMWVRLYGGNFNETCNRTLSTSATSICNENLNYPLYMPEKTDIKMHANEVSANNTALSGYFTILLRED